MKYIINLIFFFCCSLIGAQVEEKMIYRTIDSLIEVENNSANIADTTLMNLYYTVGEFYKNRESYDSALIYFDKSIELSKSVKLDLTLSEALNEKGFILYYQGNVSESIEYFHKSLKLVEKIGEKSNVAFGLNNLATVYASQGYEDKALDYFNKSIVIQEELGNKNGIALALNNVAYIYINREKYIKALEVLKKSLKLEEELKDSIDISNLFSNIGYVYKIMGDFDLALDYLKKATVIQDKIGGDKYAIATTYKNLGDVMLKKGRLVEAESYGKQSLSVAVEIGVPDLIKNSSELLKRVYKAEGKGMEAFAMSELFHKMKDSLYNKDTQRATANQQAKYKYEKQKAVDDERNKNLFILEKTVRDKQRIMIVSILFGLLILLAFLIFVYKKLRETRGQKRTIEVQKQEVEFVNKKLNQLNNEVSDSINYAELIQQAVLPTLHIESLKKEAFIYFNPKDRVSGDFYWIEQKEEYNGYAVADCTGHGIPGAFIAMIGTILLNEIYNSKKIYVPNEILDELSRLIKLTLTSKEGFTMNDGMDISFTVLNNETKMLYFSGANNPVWILSKEPEKRINKTVVKPIYSTDRGYLYEIKGDKRPIGAFSGVTSPFTLNSAHLQEGDVFYLFSDGYVDQFGGDRGKKMKSKLFKELLVEIYELPMDKQKKLLIDYFNNWKVDLEQVDDVCILGVKI